MQTPDFAKARRVDDAVLDPLLRLPALPQVHGLAGPVQQRQQAEAAAGRDAHPHAQQRQHRVRQVRMGIRSIPSVGLALLVYGPCRCCGMCPAACCGWATHATWPSICSSCTNFAGPACASPTCPCCATRSRGRWSRRWVGLQCVWVATAARPWVFWDGAHPVCALQAHKAGTATAWPFLQRRAAMQRCAGRSSAPHNL